MHKAEFKAKVALTALKGELTMAEMVKKFDVQAAQISQWKKQLVDRAGSALDTQDKAAEDAHQTVQSLHAKIGQLTMENDFLERGLERIHGSSEKNDLLRPHVANQPTVRVTRAAKVDLLVHARARER